MSKAVMASIKPYYVFLIIAKYMGWDIPQDKKVEVRKGFPKSKDWNKKVEIYCSKNKKSFNRIPKEYQPLMRPFLGKVIGEFVCDYVEPLGFGSPSGVFYESNLFKMTCLKPQEFIEYANDTAIYGWQISDLKIYDKPKELNEFKRLIKCKDWYNGMSGCEDVCGCYENGCCINGIRKDILTRPPQSWCYVKELEE